MALKGLVELGALHMLTLLVEPVAPRDLEVAVGVVQRTVTRMVLPGVPVGMVLQSLSFSIQTRLS